MHKAKDELLTVMLQWLRNAPDEPGGGPSATKQTLLGMIEEIGTQSGTHDDHEADLS